MLRCLVRRHTTSEGGEGRGGYPCSYSVGGRAGLATGVSGVVRPPRCRGCSRRGGRRLSRRRRRPWRRAGRCRCGGRQRRRCRGAGRSGRGRG
ncbi:hypothetical protein DY218_09895 [Streptomyces triticagri]|uniref:Uncharacterized protein n=1 Tax=Streptomyces triticagri TaxID=2293568 RepID=A0A372M939_9ACTN|nr:hypothetical protein DY218_09895 [Streptomyces triticagri]